MTLSLLTTALTPEQRSALETRGHLRLSPALPERFAVAVLQTLRAAPHLPTQHVDPEQGHQLINRLDRVKDAALVRHAATMLFRQLLQFGRKEEGRKVASRAFLIDQCARIVVVP